MAAEHTTQHADLGTTSWYTARAGDNSKKRAAWQHTELPEYASELTGRAAFAWRAMDAFYEEIDVEMDGTRMRLEPGQTVVPHGVDRDLTIEEFTPERQL